MHTVVQPVAPLYSKRPVTKLTIFVEHIILLCYQELISRLILETFIEGYLQIVWQATPFVEGSGITLAYSPPYSIRTAAFHILLA